MQLIDDIKSHDQKKSFNVTFFLCNSLRSSWFITSEAREINERGKIPFPQLLSTNSRSALFPVRDNLSLA